MTSGCGRRRHHDRAEGHATGGRATLPGTYHPAVTASAGAPAGLLLTDVEGSTRHLRRLGDRYGDALARHLGAVRGAVRDHGGTEVGSEGDSIAAVFPTALDAAQAALGAHAALAAEQWDGGSPLRARMAVHAGAVEQGAAGTVGIALHEAARLRNAGHGGQVLVSDAARNGLRDGDLELRDLGRHELRDVEGAVRIWQLVGDGLDPDFPALRTAVHRRVPTALTTFVGRSDELGDVLAELDSHRLVTVTGPGGSGKTRLAFEAALRADSVDLVAVVELADVTEGRLVDAAVGAALGAEPPTQAGIAGAVAAAAVLLVLDNCEHLLDDVGRLVAGLLRVCPGLRVLATSREPLDVAGEQVWRIPRLDRDDAAALFAERARAAAGTAVPAERSAVDEVCDRLDGVPLAIELAAARLRALPLPELVARLDHQPALLSGGGRDVPRQRTLRAALDWSHDLLTGDEQRLLRRLAVFAGGLPLPAAEAVSDPGTDPLDALDGLVRKSLVEFDAERGRYRLLEPVRQYAVERLEAAGEDRTTRLCHLGWVTHLAERVGATLFTDQAARMAEVDAERANIASALRFALDTGTVEPAARIVGSLGYYWFTSRRSDGAAWAGPVVAAATEVPDRVRARLLLGAGTVHADDTELGAAAQWLEEAVVRYRGLGNDRGVGWSLFWLGRCYARLGRPHDAERCFELALEQFRRLGDALGMGWSLSWLGGLASEDHLAREEEVLRLGQEHDVPHIVGNSLRMMALLLVREGRAPEAGPLAEDAVTTYRRLGDRWQLLQALHTLVIVRLATDAPSAVAPAAEAVELATSIRSVVDMRLSCTGVARVLRALGRPRAAAVLLAAAHVPGLERSVFPDTASDLAADVAWLDDPAWADAVAEGERLPVLAAVDRARAELQDVARGRSDP